jgi:hypothetical protein
VESGQTPPLPCRISTLPKLRRPGDHTSTSSLHYGRLYRSVGALAAISGNVVVALGVHQVGPFLIVSHSDQAISRTYVSLSYLRFPRWPQHHLSKNSDNDANRPVRSSCYRVNGVKEGRRRDRPRTGQDSKLHNQNVIRHEGPVSSKHECLLSIITRHNYVFSLGRREM